MAILFLVVSVFCSMNFDVQASESTKHEPRPGMQSTPLMMAASNNDLQEAMLLVQQGAALDAQDAAGRTALMYAIYPRFHGWTAGYGNQAFARHGHSLWHDNQGQIQMVQFLLKQGAKVDITDNDGMTALMHARTSLQPQLVTILLAHGADTSIKTPGQNTYVKDKKGKTVFDLQTQYMHRSRSAESKANAPKLEEEMKKILDKQKEKKERKEIRTAAKIPVKAETVGSEEERIYIPAQTGIRGIVADYLVGEETPEERKEREAAMSATLSSSSNSSLSSAPSGPREIVPHSTSSAEETEMSEVD